MIDQATISPTVSAEKQTKPIDVIQIIVDNDEDHDLEEESRDMIAMLEDANEELRVLMDDNGSEEVEIVAELKNSSESSDEWDDDDDDSDCEEDASCKASLASHHVDKIEEIVGDIEEDDDDDNESTDEWHDEQKITFEKVMNIIAFPEKHLFVPQHEEEEEGVEVDDELGVAKSDSEFGDEPPEEKKVEAEEEKKVEEVDTIEKTQSAVSAPPTPLTVNTSLDESAEDHSSSESSSAENEKDNDTKSKKEDEPSIEVVLPADHGLNKAKRMTPLASPRTPRQWLANWFQPGDRVTVTVTKESKKEPLGVFIKKVLLKDGLYISQLQEGSEIAATDLKPGMKILFINNAPCPQTVKDFRELVSTMEGPVTIVAQPPEDENEGLVVVTVFKESKTQPLGLVLKRQMFREGLVVAKILEGSIFKHSQLEEGMRIVRVNDQPCPGTVDAFRNFLQEIEGQVKIVAEPTVAQMQAKQAKENAKTKGEETDDSTDQQEDSTFSAGDENQEPPPMPKIFQHHGVQRKEVVCNIVKEGTHEPLGLLLREFKDEKGIHILQLDENGKLGSTSLKTGMTIHKINGQECPHKVDECIKLLKSISGELTIVASEIYEE